MLRLFLIAMGSAWLCAAEPAAISLAGRWSFQLDARGAGERERWFDRALPLSIQLPGSTDQAGFGEATTGSTYGMLTRVHKYIGPAWYQRDVEIPTAWHGAGVELVLERVLWQSKAWVDGRPAGVEDSLGTPHTHWLGRLTPGRHRLTIRVTNEMVYPIGDKGHLYTEYTQTIWNGMVGRIELRPRPEVRLGLVRVFPDAAARQVTVEAEVVGGAGTVGVVVKEAASGRIVARGTTSQPLTLTEAPKLWDEFEPNLYQAEVTLNSAGRQDRQQIQFGFRSIARSGRTITLNGRRVFFRGNLDCVQFPLTGYPSTDVVSWRRIFRIYKEHGLNHVRFHSWCPPQAAFEAADELGIYAQVEVLWVDAWMSRDNPDRPYLNTPGRPQGVGKGDRSTDLFVRAEMRRILDTNGNHPSFVLLCIGNEMGNADFNVLARWIAEEKTRNPRHLYSASTARSITASDDYNVTHMLADLGPTRGHVEPGTDWDYEKVYDRAPVPVIAHEIGQWPVYPAWSEIGKYTGTLRARNLAEFREVAIRNGIGNLDQELRAASGASSRQMYKYEVESFLRTPSCSGVQLLSMQDFPGQGEALVGWLDSFYDSKGTVVAADFRRWFGPTVPLLRMGKFVWRNDETLAGTVDVAHYGIKDLNNLNAVWTLEERGGGVATRGVLVVPTLRAGGLTSIGRISIPLDRFRTAAQLRLTIRLDGTLFANEWDVWVYPAEASLPHPAGVLVTRELDPALAALASGGKVVLLADALGDQQNTKLAAWMPLYWSLSYMPRQNRETLGALVDAKHPALTRFPTEAYLGWQWFSLCQGARGFVLDGLSKSYRPIVQPVDDFHFNHKLGSIFELRTRAGGKLLVCGYNLGSSPEARQLYRSLVEYTASAAFSPAEEVSEAFLRDLFSHSQRSSQR
jgi:beta-galactosidase